MIHIWKCKATELRNKIRFLRYLLSTRPTKKSFARLSCVVLQWTMQRYENVVNDFDIAEEGFGKCQCKRLFDNYSI